MVEIISEEAVHTLLDPHEPGICENMHFICRCGWHEPTNAENGTPIGQWYKEWVAHLLAPKQEVMH